MTTHHATLLTALLLTALGCGAPETHQAPSSQTPGPRGKGDIGRPEAPPETPPGTGDVTPPPRYLPNAPWSGRLILPALEARQAGDAVGFEVLHAPEPALIGEASYKTMFPRHAHQGRARARHAGLGATQQPDRRAHRGRRSPSADLAHNPTLVFTVTS